MKTIHIITGVSGAGKSTICKELQAQELDADGVPSHFTTLKEWVMWRKDRTIQMIKSVVWYKYGALGSIICGTIIPCEFWKLTYPEEPNIKFKFCLLTCSDDSIRDRLGRRGWNEEQIEGNVKLSGHLEWEMLREFDDGLVVDTDKPLEECVKEIKEWIDV